LKELLAIKFWWHQVKEAPEVNNTKVFANGISQGSKAWIPKGGQVEPNSTLGANDEWKKAQNIDKKKILLILQIM